jgi:hypothetical protein
MFTDQSVTQQLAALVAVVAIAILAVAILLVPATWQGVNNTFIRLINPQKKTIYKFTLFYFALFLLFLFVTDFTGIYAQEWFQPIARASFLLIIIICSAYFAISKIVKWWKKEKQEPVLQIMPALPLSYLITLVWVALCILFCLTALLGVSQAMLNIEIGPFNQDNYNWGIWFLENGILFFILSIVNLGFTYIFQKIDLNTRESGKPQKNIHIGIYIFLFALLIGAFGLSYKGLSEEIKKDHSNIISYFFSVPLTIKTINGTQGNLFFVTNENNFDWQNITFSINDMGISSGYYFYSNELKQGGNLDINLMEFAKTDGTRFNILDTKPLTIKIKVYNSLGQSGTYYGTWN